MQELATQPSKIEPVNLASEAVAKRKPKPKKPKAKRPAKSKAKKRKAAPKKKSHAKPKAGAVVRSERLDMRLTKAEKAKIHAKANKTRRTVTSLVIEAIEKIK